MNDIEEIHVAAGEYFGNVCKRLVERVFQKGVPMFIVFNGYEIVANPGDTVDDLYQKWNDLMTVQEIHES